MRLALPNPPGLRALAGFWIALIAIFAAGIGVLQILGPPAPASTAEAPPPASRAEAPAAPPVAAVTAPPPSPPADPQASAAEKPATARAIGAAIPAPLPALLEPSGLFPDAKLPRIGADGRKPMLVYAAGWDPADKRPRVALLLAGLGLNESESLDAIRALPAAISFAVSPYAAHPETALAPARAAGHETLVSIPMEPQGYPLNDAGPRALLSSAVPAQNLKQLEWVLSRFGGYAGATGALEGMRGERLAASAENFAALQDQLAQRGLLYVDPRPGEAAPAHVVGRTIDLVVDEPATRADIDAKLFQLERLARERGSALGLAGPLRPVTITQIAIWANGLYAHGITLVPVSALVTGAAR